LLCGGKDYFCKKPIFSKDYSLKEQVWLAIYAGQHAKRQFSPPLLIRLATLFLKGRLSPAFSFTPCTIYQPAMMGNRKQAI